MRRFTRRLSLGLAALIWSLVFAGTAWATGTVRLEYLKSGNILSAEVISATGTSVQGSAAPDFGGVGGRVRIRGVAGVVIVTFPSTPGPTATQTNGFRFQSCDDPVELPIATGDKVAIIEDASASACPSGGGGGGGGDASAANQVTQSGKLDTLHSDLALLTAPNVAPLVCNASASITGTSQTQLCAAPGAAKNNYITQIICGNSSASVGTFIDVEDGISGTVLVAVPAGPNYQGGTLTFGPQGLKQPTANTALYVVDETTGAAVKCSAVGYTK